MFAGIFMGMLSVKIVYVATVIFILVASGSTKKSNGSKFNRFNCVTFGTLVSSCES